MADVLAPEGGELEGVVAPPEEETEVVQTPRTVEDYARERGWRPKEEWTGSGEWKDAETFLSYGLERARDLGDTVRNLNRKLDTVSRTQEIMVTRAQQEARDAEKARWEKMLTTAVEEGDASGAIEASQKIAELNVMPVAQVPGEVNQFRQKNAWFDSDPIARSVAVTAAQQIADTGGTVADQLKAAKEAVLKRFPEYAPQSPAVAPAKVVGVSAPTARTAARSNGKKGFADLTAEQQLAAKYLVQTGRIKSVDAYVAQAFNSEGTIE